MPVPQTALLFSTVQLLVMGVILPSAGVDLCVAVSSEKDFVDRSSCL
jgi:hypothetical protein